MKAGSLYHTVERLQRNGLIEVVDTQRDGRRPERTVYGMTQAGLDEFASAAASSGRPRDGVPRVPAGLAVDRRARQGGRRCSSSTHRVTPELRAEVAADQAVLEQPRPGPDAARSTGSTGGTSATSGSSSSSLDRAAARRPASGRIPFQDRRPTQASHSSPARRDRMNERRLTRGRALGALCLGFFMILLDTTIVSMANPTMLRELNAEHEQGRLGDQRLPAHLRRADAVHQPPRGPLRPQAGLPRRPGGVHAGLAVVRAVRQRRAC